MKEQNLEEPNLKEPNLKEPNLKEPNLKEQNLKEPKKWLTNQELSDIVNYLGNKGINSYFNEDDGGLDFCMSYNTLEHENDHCSGCMFYVLCSERFNVEKRLDKYLQKNNPEYLL